MKRVAIGLACVVLAIGTAHAASVSLSSVPVTLPTTMIMQIQIANTCAGQATYSAIVKTAETGAILKANQQGTLLARRGVIITYSSPTVTRSLVVGSVTVTCAGTVIPKPLVNISILPRNAANGPPAMTLPLETVAF